MFKQIALSLLRHGLTAGGGYLVAKGTLSTDQVAELSGALMALVGVVASFLDKKVTADAVYKLNK